MKKENQVVLFDMLRDMVDVSVQLGEARQRHRDAAQEEGELGEEVNAIANAIGQFLNNGGKIIPKNDLN